LVPKTWYSRNEIDKNCKIVLKRIKGSGSIDLKYYDSVEGVPLEVDHKFLFQENIEGIEYGMDILNDLSGKFVHCCVRKKIEMRAGETDKAEVIYSKELTEVAKKISLIFKHIGNLDIDFIIDKNKKVYFIDFNPRFGGGYPYTHMAGFNYLKAIIDFYNKKEVKFSNKGKRVIAMKGVEMFSYEVGNE
jgi:carbamoyl-phosphate synthase large subunit